ncbi:unnamed protein product [Sympodiomycopsis kandeliae]
MSQSNRCPSPRTPSQTAHSQVQDGTTNSQVALPPLHGRSRRPICAHERDGVPLTQPSAITDAPTHEDVSCDALSNLSHRRPHNVAHKSTSSKTLETMGVSRSKSPVQRSRGGPSSIVRISISLTLEPEHEPEFWASQSSAGPSLASSQPTQKPEYSQLLPSTLRRNTADLTSPGHPRNNKQESSPSSSHSFGNVESGLGTLAPTQDAASLYDFASSQTGTTISVWSSPPNDAPTRSSRLTRNEITVVFPVPLQEDSNLPYVSVASSSSPSLGIYSTSSSPDVYSTPPHYDTAEPPFFPKQEQCGSASPSPDVHSPATHYDTAEPPFFPGQCGIASPSPDVHSTPPHYDTTGSPLLPKQEQCGTASPSPDVYSTPPHYDTAQHPFFPKQEQCSTASPSKAIHLKSVRLPQLASGVRAEMDYQGVLTIDDLGRLRQEFGSIIICPGYTAQFGSRMDDQYKLFIPGAASGYKVTKQRLAGWAKKGAEDPKYSWWQGKLEEKGWQAITGEGVLDGVPRDQWIEYTTLYRRAVNVRMQKRMQDRRREAARKAKLERMTSKQ